MRIYPVFLSHAGCRQRCVFCNQRRLSALSHGRKALKKPFITSKKVIWFMTK